ncbi:MAG: hypothetical protein ACT4NT_01790 [Nitrososphaerota archaeon]
MQSKKGFIITGIVLAAITAGSFMVWMVPQNTQTEIIVSDPNADLDAIIEQQKTITEATIAEFSKMLGGGITPDEYIGTAEISSSQINSLIIKIIESDASTEWRDSYSSLADYLRSHNSYVRETIVIAEKLKADPVADISQDMTGIDGFLQQADEFLAASNGARPS